MNMKERPFFASPFHFSGRGALPPNDKWKGIKIEAKN